MEARHTSFLSNLMAWSIFAAAAIILYLLKSYTGLLIYACTLAYIIVVNISNTHYPQEINLKQYADFFDDKIKKSDFIKKYIYPKDKKPQQDE